MVRVTFENGEVREYGDNEVVRIETFPPRTTPKAGWERTREYPPEYRRATALHIGVLTVSHFMPISSGYQKVAKIEKLPGEPG